VYFHLLSPIEQVEMIAAGRSIRDLARIEQRYGVARWRKLKGLAQVQLRDGSVHLAEVHWYEAQGVGRRLMKIKRLMD
jgi:hypothetical protein